MARIALVASSPSREQIGAEFLELDRRVQDFSPTAKRYKVLQDHIRSWYADSPPELACVFEGSDFRIHVGARGEERSLPLAARLKIFRLLGKAKALELFTITLRAVDDALGTPVTESLVVRSYTGSRKLVAVMKAAIPAALAA